ncbi:MAG: pyridoxamine 5'-phosphate oxidase family protein [Candidatus Dormibacteraeota bacterium]|nr:pyridoxamine 5'-phosphate oxidase family protein [Candidatus Dormibacteraeota bacterium]
MAELTERQRRVLEGKNFYSVSTIGRDGGPRSTTVWGDLRGDHVELNSIEGRGWPGNLARDPRIAIEVHDEGDPYNQVSIVGRAVELTTEGGQEGIDALSRKYAGKDYGTPAGQTRVRIRVEIDRARSWGD